MAEAVKQTKTSEFDSASFLKNLTSRPGVYRMIDDTGTVIYVGKAKNLKKRVSSYFRNRPVTRLDRPMEGTSWRHEVQDWPSATVVSRLA